MMERVNAQSDPFVDLHTELVKLWESAPLPSQVSFEDGSREHWLTAATTAVGWGWLVRIIQTGRAAMILVRQGFASEAAPLLRSILEHTIRLAYASDVGFEAIEVGLRERSRSIEKLRSAQANGWHLEPDFLVALDRAQAEASEEFRHLDAYAHLAHIVRQYPGLGSFYMAWLLETQVSHPTLASAQPYFDRDDSSHELQLHRQGQEAGELTSAQLCATLLTAMKAYARIAGLTSFFKEPLVFFDKCMEDLVANRRREMLE